MNISLLLTILGIIATLILGTWSIILFFRTKYPGKITFYIEDIIGLFDSIVKNLPELSILYNNANVSQNLFLLKGCFVNVGYKDITESMVEERISLKLPKNYQILTARVVNTDSSVKASIEIDSNHNLMFNIGLFRIKEYFRIEALIEIQSEEKSFNPSSQKTILNDIEESIVLTHRISDTKKINKERIEEVPELKRNKSLQFLIPGSLSVLALMMILFYSIGDTFTIQYDIIENNKTFEVNFFPRSIKSIELIGVNNDYNKIISVDQYKKIINESEIKIVPYKEIQLFGSTLLNLAGVLVVLVFLMSLFMYIERRNNIKFLKQIGLK